MFLSLSSTIPFLSFKTKAKMEPQWPKFALLRKDTFSSWIFSSILLEAISWALKRAMVLVSSGSKMFPLSSRTTKSNPSILERKTQSLDLLIGKRVSTADSSCKNAYLERLGAGQVKNTSLVFLLPISASFPYHNNVRKPIIIITKLI